MIELHKLLMPPHPGNVYTASALCTCGGWQYDADTPSYLYREYRIILTEHTAHVLERIKEYDSIMEVRSRG